MVLGGCRSFLLLVTTDFNSIGHKDVTCLPKISNLFQDS